MYCSMWCDAQCTLHATIIRRHRVCVCISVVMRTIYLLYQIHKHQNVGAERYKKHRSQRWKATIAFYLSKACEKPLLKHCFCYLVRNPAHHHPLPTYPSKSVFIHRHPNGQKEVSSASQAHLLTASPVRPPLLPLFPFALRFCVSFESENVEHKSLIYPYSGLIQRIYARDASDYYVLVGVFECTMNVKVAKSMRWPMVYRCILTGHRQVRSRNEPLQPPHTHTRPTMLDGRTKGGQIATKSANKINVSSTRTKKWRDEGGTVAI